MIGSRGQAPPAQYFWARGRAQSAGWLVFDGGLVCFWLTGPASVQAARTLAFEGLTAARRLTTTSH